MEQLTKNAIAILEEQRYKQQDFCAEYNLDATNFSVRKGKNKLTVKTIEMIYDCFGMQFNLCNELKALVQFELDTLKHPVRGIPRKLGISYSRAKFFVSKGKCSHKILHDLYNHGQEARAIIDKYLIPYEG